MWRLTVFITVVTAAVLYCIYPKTVAKLDGAYTYNATVGRVIDGDTVDLDVNLGLNTHTYQRIRVAEIDAPELSTTRGQNVKTYVQHLLPVGSTVTLLTIQDKREKYGRYLGYIKFNNIDLGTLLLHNHMAVRYYGGPHL